MTDSGQPPKTPPHPPVPGSAPSPEAESSPPPPAGAPPDIAATMRLIPVPPPTTPPPPVAAITTPPQVPGEHYIGKYRVKGELGRGGRGAVYLAEQPGLGREVAIKEPIQSADPVALQRLRRDAPVME